MNIWKKPHFPLVITLFAIWLLGTVRLTTYLDRKAFDDMVKASARPELAPTNAVMVLVDEQSLKTVSERFGVRWPWPRSLFAALIIGLHQAGAKEIAVDLLFMEESDPVHDEVLAAAAAAWPQTTLGRQANKGPVFWNKDFAERFPGLAVTSQSALVDFPPEGDGVYRRYPFAKSLAASATTQSATGLPLLRWYGSVTNAVDPANLFLPANIVLPAERFVILGNKLQDELRKQKVDETDPVKLAAALAAMPKLVEGVEGMVKDKVVFVGTSAAATLDLKATPVGKIQPGVLVHYTAWANAERGEFIRPVSAAMTFPVSALVAAGLVLYGWKSSKVGMVIVMGLVIIVAVVAGVYLLMGTGIFFPPSGAVLSVVVAMLVSVSHNFWLERERKREIRAMFGSYISKQVVAKLLDNPDAIKMGGEKKELTVFFSDLAGFTDLSETMPPEDLVRIINWYLAEMTELVIDEGAYVDKYIGDAVMAVFGSPEPLANHALSACRAAIACRDRLVEMNSRMPIKVDVTLLARIGINTGEMVVGNVGSEQKKNYTVLGDPVNLAARLEPANKKFDTLILIGENTEKMARGHIVTRPISLLRVKGKKRPNQTYELVGLPGKVPAQEMAFVTAYTAGYEAYQKREFHTAVIELRKAKAIKPDEKMVCLYLDEAEQFAENPPGPEWDGVLVLKSK